MKTISKALCLLLSVLLSSICHGFESDRLVISPASGSFLSGTDIEFSVVVDTQGEKVMHLDILHNSENVTEWFRRCFSTGYTSDNRQYFRCNLSSGALFGTGPNRVEVRAHVTNMGAVSGEVSYTVLSVQPEESVRLHVAGSQPPNGTNTLVVPYHEYEIRASGVVHTWPHEADFPSATPDGNGLYCQNSCLLRGAPVGALIGRLDGGPWRVIGSRSFTGDRPGNWEFTVNDSNFEDNLGGFDVEIVHQPRWK